MSRVAHLIGALTGLKNPPSRRQPKRRKMVFEPLDQRLLLSGTPFYSAAGAQAAVHLTVQLSDINGTSTLQVVDSQQGVVASAAVNNLRGTLDIVGSRFGDTLTLASDLSSISGKVTFSGGGGSDTLAGPRADTQWTISGSDAGSVDGLVFTGVARLAGADNNQDTFTFGALGGLSGGVDGGAGGFDSVVLSGGTFTSEVFSSTSPSAGTISRDSNVIAYTGMEPITDLNVVANRTFNGVAGLANNITLSYNGTTQLMVFASNNAETVNFKAPTASLTLNGLGTTDTIALSGLAPAFGANLQVNGNSTLSSTVTFGGALSSNARVAVANATDIAVNANVSANTGISLAATRSVAVANNVNLTASLGNISLSATNSLDLVWNRNVAGFKDSTVNTSVTVGGGAVLSATNITLAATSTSTKYANFVTNTLALASTATSTTATMAGAPQLTFTDNGANGPDTLTRGAGTWRADGFAPGRQITITGAGANNGDYQIQSLSADGKTLTIEPVSAGNKTDFANASFAAGNAVGVVAKEILPGDVPLLSLDRNVNMSLDIAGSLPLLTFKDVVSGDTLKRDTGSWLADGFVVGQRIYVKGSLANDGVYRIGAISADGLTITINQGAMLNEGPLAGAGGLVTVQGINEVVGAIVAKDLQDPANLGNLNFLATIDPHLGSIEVGLVLGVVSNASATVTVDGTLIGRSDVQLNSTARSNATLGSAGGPAMPNATYLNPALRYSQIGATYLDSEASAVTHLGSGAVVTAGNIATIVANANNKALDTTTLVAGTRTPQTLGSPTASGAQVAGAAIAVTYEKARTNAEATVGQGASVQADFFMTIGATSSTDIAAKTGSQTIAPQKNMGQGVGLTWIDNAASAVARIDGRAREAAGGQGIFITATSTIAHNDADTQVSTAGKPNATGLTNKITGAQGSASNAYTPGQLGISAGIVLVDSSNQATAAIGNGAVVYSDRDVQVQATTVDNFKAIAVGGSGAGAELSIGGAVALVNYSDHADASIGDNATVDARGNLLVRSQATIPNQVTAGQNFLNAAAATQADINTTLTDLSNLPALSVTPAQPIQSAKTSQANAQAYFNKLKGDASLLKDDLAAFLDAAVPYYNQTSILPNQVATTYALASAAPKDGSNANTPLANYAVAGAVTLMSIDNSATSHIGKGARINQTVALQNAFQSVQVVADASVQVVDIAGISTLRSLYQGQTSSNTLSLAGSYVGLTEHQTAQAYIDDGASVFADSVSITANTHNLDVALLAAGGQSKDAAISGAVSYNELHNTALAYVEDGANLTTTGNLTLTARNELTVAAVTGTVSRAGDLGVGLAASVNKVTDNAQAFIGGNNADVRSGTDLIGGDANINASNSEQLIAVAIAATNTAPPQQGGNDGQVAPGIGQQGQSADSSAAAARSGGGVGISGAVALNFSDETTNAFVATPAKLSVGRNLNITATGEAPVVIALAGPIALDTSGNRGSTGIAGGFNENNLTRHTAAYDSADTTTVGNTNVSATTNDLVIAIGASAAGQKKAGTAAIAGAVNLELITSDTRAYVVPSGALRSSVVGGNLKVAAADNLQIVSVAGGFAVSGKFGLGAGIDVGIIKPTVLAYVGQNVSTPAGSISITAHDQAQIVAVAAALGLATDQSGLGLAGAAISQNIISDVEASVQPNAQISALGSLLVAADDRINAVAVSGGAGGGGKAGIGAAVANVNIGDTAANSQRKVLATIGSGAVVDAKGQGLALSDPAGLVSGNGVLVSASAIDSLVLVGASGAGGNTLGFAASATVTTELSLVEAKVGAGARIDTDATGASATQNLQLRANHRTTITGVAGALGVSGSAAIGAAADVQVLNRTVKADIDSSAALPTQVAAVQNILVDAETQTRLNSIAIGLSGSGDIALAGSASVVKNTTTTESFIGASANAVAGANVLVTADHETRVLAIGGAGAVGSSIGIGASTAVVLETEITKAYVGVGAFVFAQAAGGSVSVRDGNRLAGGAATSFLTKGVAVSATGYEGITGAVIGAAVGSDAAVSGSVPVVVLDNATLAYVDHGAQINQGVLAANVAQDVNILAGDVTEMLMIGGSGALGGAAVGASVDVAVLNKDTEAFVASATSAANPTRVNAQGDLLVQARSRELINAGNGALVAGGASLGGAVGVFLVGTADRPLLTRAAIGAGAQALALRNIGVSAVESTTVFDLSGSGTYGGTVGIGAAAAVPVVNKQTDALIDNDAVVDALGNGAAMLQRNGSFDVAYVDFGGGDGYGNPPPTDPTNLRPPKITGSALDCTPALTKQRVATPALEAVHGIVVSATNQDNIEIFAVGGAASGGVAVSLAGTVNVQHADTQAWVGDRASINQRAGANAAQGLLVTAGNDYFHLGVAGAASASSSAGVSPAADVAVISEDAIAHIGKSAQVQAQADVRVLAANREEVLSIAAGLAVGGQVGLAGTVALIDINNHALAYIDSAAPASTNTTTVVAGGNVVVSATDDTGSYIIAGSAALGGAAGFGIAVGVNDVHKDTRAFIADGVSVTARAATSTSVAAFDQLDPVTGLQTVGLHGVVVQAASSENLCTIVAAGAGGGFVGLAGAVGVSIIDSATQAFVGKQAKINSLGSVNVAAFNNLHLDTKVGGIGLALGGAVAGGVDVGVVRSGTQAYIDDGATVAATGSVGVNAFAQKNIDSLAISGALGGVAGIAGSVSVYSIGANPDGNANQSLQGGNSTSLTGSLNSSATTSAINSRLADFSSRAINTTEKSSLDQGNSQSHARNFSADYGQPVVSGTSAHIGSRAAVTAGDDINVRAKDNLAFNAVTGQGAAAAIAIGASVSVANIGLTDTAWVAPSAALSVGPDAGDDITLDASLRDSKLMAKAYGGQGGALALGGQVTVLNDNSAQLAYIDQGVVVKRADHLNVLASAVRPAELYSGGAQVGGLAVGVSVANARLAGSTIAFIGHDPAALRPATVRTVVNYLNITADNNSTASTEAFAATVGILNGTGTDTTASVTPTIKAYLDGNNIARVNNTASITAHAVDDADARAYGVGVGAVAVGVSYATATASPQMQAYIGAGAGITTGQDLIVQSVDNYGLTQDANGTLLAITSGVVPVLQSPGRVDGGRHPDDDSSGPRNNGAYATTFSSSGSLLGGGDGATSTATGSAVLFSHVDGGAIINSGGNVSVLTLGLNDAHALASGVTFGLVAGGGSKTSIANAQGSATAALDGRVVRGANLDVQALSTDTGHAVTDAIAASVGGAGLNSTSRTTITPSVVARIGHESFTPFGGALDIGSSTFNLGYVHGYSTGQQLVYNNGTPDSGDAFSLPVQGGATLATLVNGATYYAITSPGSTQVQLAATLADAQAGRFIRIDPARFAALIANGANGKQSLTPPAPVPYATVSGDVHVLGKSFSDGDAAASGTAGSVGISAGLTYAFSTVTPTVKGYLGQNGVITAGGVVTVEAQQGRPIVAAGNSQFDPTTAVHTGPNTITLTNHGLLSGAQVNYSRNGGGDIGLADQRTYDVIVVDANTLKLGDTFVAANVDAASSSIRFAGGHTFKSGDEVVYDNGGGANTGGLLGAGHYFVKVLDPTTIQLYTTRAAALAQEVSFSAASVSASNSATPNQITLPASQTLDAGTLVTYRTVPANFNDGLVGVGGFDNNGAPIAKANVIYFGTDYLASHPLATGSQIKYHTDNQVLNGLVNNQTYFVINNGDGTIGLSLTANGPALVFSVAPTDHRLGSVNFQNTAVSSDAGGGIVSVPNLAALNLSNGQALLYTALDAVVIGGLQNNTTYYVVLDATLTNAFRLATSLSLAQGRVATALNGNVSSAHSFVGSGPIGGLQNGSQYRVIANANGTISLAAATGPLTVIALNPAGVFGLQSLSPTAVALAPSASAATQSLSIALKATADATLQALVATNNGAQLGGGADGIVSAVANAAAYSVLGAGTGSETGITLSPNASGFLEMGSTVSAAKVQVQSTSSAQTSNSDTNRAGSFVAATNPYAHTNINHSNQAYLGAGVTVNASGDFVLDATSAQGGNLVVDAAAGAGISVVAADHSGQGLFISYSDTARLGQNGRVTAGGTASVTTHVNNSASATSKADARGFGGGAYAAVTLQVLGSELSEVGSLTRLSASKVVLDSTVDAFLSTNSDAFGAGFGAAAYATSNLTATISPAVAVRDRALVTGSQSVKVNASNGNIVAFNVAHTTTEGVFAFSVAETDGALISTPTLTATPSATVTTPTLTVTSASTGLLLALVNLASRDVYAIDAGHVNTNASYALTPINNFNPTRNFSTSPPTRTPPIAAAPLAAADAVQAQAVQQPAAAAPAALVRGDGVRVFDPELGLFVSRKATASGLAAVPAATQPEFVRYAC